MSDSDSRPPITLSPVERQTLLLQHQILTYLEPDEADHHKRMVEVLSQGYTLEYENLFTPYDELPTDDCEVVVKILTMFRVIKASLSALPAPEQDALTGDYECVVAFRGFDGNDSLESKMLGYVSFLQSTGRWTELRQDVEAADGGNSHTRMLPRYRAMLSEYRTAWDEVMKDGPSIRYQLNHEQLRRITTARPGLHTDWL